MGRTGECRNCLGCLQTGNLGRRKAEKVEWRRRQWWWRGRGFVRDLDGDYNQS